MNLELFEDAGARGTLVLLHGGGPEEVGRLREALRTLAEGTCRRLALHGLQFVRSVGDCRLTAVLAATDIGVVAHSWPGELEWALDAESWIEVAELLEPFCEEASGARFQHLNRAGGPEVLYSTERAW